jgi:hypothetical protein
VHMMTEGRLAGEVHSRWRLGPLALTIQVPIRPLCRGRVFAVRRTHRCSRSERRFGVVTPSAVSTPPLPACRAQVLSQRRDIGAALPVSIRRLAEDGGLGAASRRERALTVILIAEEGRVSTQRATAATSLIGPVLDPRWMRQDIIITLMESRALLVTLAIGSSGWPVV